MSKSPVTQLSPFLSSQDIEQGLSHSYTSIKRVGSWFPQVAIEAGKAVPPKFYWGTRSAFLGSRLWICILSVSLACLYACCRDALLFGVVLMHVPAIC